MTTIWLFPAYPIEKRVATSVFSTAIAYHILFLIFFTRTARNTMELMKYLAPFQISNSAFIFVLSASFWLTHVFDFKTVNYLTGIIIEAMLHSLSMMAIFSIYKMDSITSKTKSGSAVRNVGSWMQTDCQEISSIVTAAATFNRVFLHTLFGSEKKRGRRGHKCQRSVFKGFSEVFHSFPWKSNR